MAVSEARRAYNAAYFQANRERFREARLRRRDDPVKLARDRALAAARDRARRAALTQEELARERERITEQTWQLRLRKHYGMTVEDYKRLLAEQDGRCATCRTDQPWTRSHRFAVDHDHATGRVRGLLCHHCNRALGLVKDNPAVLRAMLDYLA